MENDKWREYVENIANDGYFAGGSIGSTSSIII